MKKISIFLVLVAIVMALFTICAFADEGTTTNIASEATITTPTSSWWITQNLKHLNDGNETTGMHSSAHDRDTTINFAFESERYITKIVMKVNGTATTTAQNKTDLNANTNYKITVNGATTTLNALDKTELVLDVNASINEFKIEFVSNWSGDNALIREVEIYEYIPPVVESATGNNIEDDATIAIVDGNDYILGGAEYLRDNDPSTGLSAGNAASWINYHFLYERPRAITKVVVVVNSTGTMYKVGSADGTYVHETMSTLPNIYLRLYDVNGNTVYKLENQSTANAVEVTKDGKTYMEYTFDLAGALYEDIVKVEIATLHNSDTKLGVWEVEIIDFQCQSDDDHKYNAATCVTPATCKYCLATTGEPSDEHTLLEANCGQPVRCKYCDYTEGEPTGEPHTWINASYTAPKTCTVCGATEGDVWVDSDLEGFIRGPENDTITYDDIIGEVELINGSNGAGVPSYVLDGITDNAAQYWGGPTNTQLKITLKHEWEISSAKVYLFANWASLKVGFYAADGTLLGEQNFGGLQCNMAWFNGAVEENPTYTDYSAAVNKLAYGDADKAVKYIIITNTGDKWGWVPGVVECYFQGRERVPFAGCVTHDFEATYPIAPTCTEAGTMVNKCTVCGAEEAPVVAPALGHDMGEYTIKVPATCVSAPVLEFACKRCGETTERDVNVDNIIELADKLSIQTQYSGGGTSANDIFDGSLDTWTLASGSWAVSGSIEFDMPYYLTSVTIWIEGGSTNAGLIVYYQAPGSDEWIRYNETAMQVPAPWNRISEYTLEIDTPVYADAIKVYVGDPDGTPQGGGPGLGSYAGRFYDVAVSGSLMNEEVAAGHTWVAGETVAPACTTYGYTQYTCSVCEAEKEGDFVFETGHTWVDATCTAPKTCSVCYETTGDPKGHKEVVDAAVAATCTTTGLTEGKHCSVCNEVLVAQETVELLDHEIVEATTNPTCTAAGSTIGVCAQCGEQITYVELAPLGHSYVAGEPVDGAITYTCSVCNDSYVVNNSAISGIYYDAMLESKYVFNNGTVTIKTPEFEGELTYTYNVTTGMITTDNAGAYFQMYDGLLTFRGATRLHKHDFSAYTVEDGKYVCSNCGSEGLVIDGEYYMGTDKVVFAAGVITFGETTFSYNYDIATGEIFVEDGKYFTVGEDGTILFAGRNPLHTHDVENLTKEVIAPTCTADGYTSYICPTCGPIYNADTVEATGHKYTYACDKICNVCNELTNEAAEHTIVHVEAKAGTDCQTWDGNVEYWYCSDCGSAWLDEALTQVTNRNSVAAKAECDWLFTGYDEYNLPTCDIEGIANYECIACGETKQETVLHRFLAPVGNVEGQGPTCTEYGYAIFECLWCSEQETRLVAPQHTYGDPTDVVNATCTEAGSQVWTCTVEGCGYSYTEEIPANGHNQKWQYDSTTATCTEAGVEIYGCYNCDAIIEVEVEAYGHEWEIDDSSLNLEAHTINRVCSVCAATEAISSLGCEEDPIVITVPGSFTASVADEWTYYTFKQSAEGYVTFTFSTGNYNIFVKDRSGKYAQQYTWGGETSWTAEIMADGDYIIQICTNDGSAEDIEVETTFEVVDIPNVGEVPEKPIVIEYVNTEYTSTGSVWYKFETPTAGTVTITVTSGTATVSYGSDPEAMVAYTAPFVDEYGWTTYYILVESTEKAGIVINVEAPKGTRDNPLVLESGDNEVSTNGGWATYYAAYENASNGTLTLTFDAEKYANVVIYAGTHPYQMQTPVTSGTTIEITAWTTYYFGITTTDQMPASFTITASFEEAAGPEMPEPDGDIGEWLEDKEVETTDTYGWFDLYNYVAQNAGKYTFAVPVGLGFYSKAQHDAYGNAEIDFYSANGGYVTVELAAGEEYSFYVGSLTKAEWTIDVYYLAPEHTCEFYVSERVESTCTTAGSVTYTCSCGESYTEALELAAHTEVEIPAVPGELRNPGMTSGIECSVCGEVIKAPVQASGDFRIASVSLSLGENIGIVYKAQVPEGYENVYMVFQMTVVENGVEVVKEFTVTDYEIDPENGRYCFTFSGVRLQWMADLVTATVYAENDGVVSANSYSNYSVKTYILSQLGKSTNSATLKTMLSDLLILGAKTQIYANYKADDLMTADVDESLLTPSTYAGVPSDEFVQKMIINDEASRSIADWKSVSLTFKDAMSYQFKLAIDPSALQDIKIVVTIPVPGKEARVDEYTAEDLEYDAVNDRYILSVDNVKALQYGETVVGDIYYKDAKISRTVNYSVNSYIQKNQDSTDVGLRDFLRAVYLYGEAVRIYSGN